MNNQPAIQISDISYSYRDEWSGKKLPALKPLNLNIEEGECFGFLGHNGAGKTTTIKCILGLITPNSGSVRLFGIDSKAPLSRAALGYVPEQPYFYDHLTVEELLKFYGGLSSISRLRLESRIDEVLARLKILDRKNSRMRTLSKGLTQKVALAQALLHDPKLLILDEPFSGLDPLGRREVREVILEEKSKNKTIFICTHVLSDVELLCDRASVLSKGELKGIVNLGPALTDRFTLITVSPNGSETQQVCNNQEQLQSELKKHLSLNSSIVSVEKISKSLEESFVELVNK